MGAGTLRSLPVVASPLFALLCLVPGLPVALLLARARRGERWSHVLLEGTLIGLGWWLALALVLGHLEHLDRPTLIAATLPVVVVLALPAARAAGGLARPRATAFGGFLALVVGAAAALRTQPSYFLYQIGDFGEYVNRANVVADGGPFIEWFTQGFSVLLALSHVVLGEAHTVAIVPFVGLLTLLTAVAIADRLGAGQWAKGVVAVVFAVGVVPVWFSEFPASESLYAVLQLAMLLFLLVAVQRASLETAVVGGSFAGLLLLTRGNGLLVLPLLLVALVATATVVSRRTVVVLGTFTASAAAAWFAAFVFNSAFSYAYFIAFQLPRYVPDALYRRVDDLDQLRHAVPAALVLAVVVALAVGAALVVNHVLGPPRQDGVAVVLRAAMLPVGVVAAVVAALGPLDHRGLAEALSRYDVAVEALAVAGLVVAMVRFGRGRADEAERAFLVAAVLVAAAFALLYAYRLPTPRPAPYYLYWDRYLYSELFPLMVVSGLWVVDAVERRVAAWARPHGSGVRWAVAGAGVLAVALLAAQLFTAGDLARKHRFLGDPYGDLAALDRLTSEPEPLPIVYIGLHPTQVPLALAHPNTYRLFALPLVQTFNRETLNTRVPPYAPDPMPAPDEVADLLREAGLDEAFVVRVVDPGSGETATVELVSDSAALQVERVGEVEVEIPILGRPLDRDEEGWTEVRLDLLVYRVELTAA